MPTELDMSLYRSSVCLCFSEIRNSKRYINGMVENADDSDRETTLCYEFHKNIRPLVLSFLHAEKETPEYRELPEECFYYLAISYLLNVPLNVFQTADTGHIRLFFSNKLSRNGKIRSYNFILNILNHDSDADGVRFYAIIFLKI